MANWYVNFGNGTNTGYYAVAQFANATNYVSTSNGGRGDYIRQLATPTVGNERVFRCTTSGLTTVEQTWNVGKNGTTTQGTAVFTECSGQEADQGPVAGVWTAPAARLGNVMQSGFAGGADTIFIASNHAETQASTIQLAVNIQSVICVTQTAVPPTGANVTTGATITATGASNFQLGTNSNCIGTFWGISFIQSATTQNLFIGTGAGAANDMRFNNCTFNLNTSNAGSVYAIGATVSTGNPGRLEFNNTTLQFSNAGQTISVGSITWAWKNTSSAIAGATFPTTLFSPATSGSTLLCEGVDLSALASGKTLVSATSTPGYGYFKDCKFNASVAIAATQQDAGGWDIRVLRSDSSGTNYNTSYFSFYGTQTTDIAVVRTGGAASGATGFSWKIATTANPVWPLPFQAMPITRPNTKTSSLTATLYGVFNGAALPNNDDIWFDLEYLGSASSPLGSIASGTKANPIAANAALTADASAWDTAATARANTTAYVVGNVIKVPDNTGRIFICTTLGTSAGSEPAGYASAVDGGSVTDGTAVFRAGVRFSLAVSATPALTGALTAYVKAAKASSTFWVDPLIAVV